MQLFLLFLCVFLGSFFSFPLCKKFYTDNAKKVVLRDLDVFSSAFIYLWGLFGILGASFMIPNLVPFNFFVALLSLTLIVFYLSYRPQSKMVQNILECLLCLAGAYLLSEGNSILMIFGASLFWLLAWRVFRSFDQFPFISMLMTVIWMISLLVVGQIVVLPSFLMVLSALIGLLIFSVFKKRLKYSCVNLGRATSSLIGYTCAGVWSYFFLKGNISSAVCAYSYYLFEIVLMAVAVFKGKKQVPLFVKSLKNKEAGVRTIKVVFWDFLLISMLSVFVLSFKQNVSSFLVFATILILYYIYMQLSNISKPIPGYKEIFGDLKQGIKDVYFQSKLAFKEKRLEKKEIKPQKKKSPVKKNQKPKGKKKK